MKITIQKSKVLKALSLMQSIPEVRITSDSLLNLRIETKKDKIEMRVTNFEVSFVCETPAEVKKQGIVTLPCKDFYNIIKGFSNEEIHLEEKNKGLKIHQGKSFFHLLGEDADKFPMFPEYKKTGFMKLKQSTFLEMINKTIYSISTDETRYHLNGVFFQTDKDAHDIKMVSTDGHRLSYISRSMTDKKVSEAFSKGVIIPRKGIVEMKKIFTEFKNNDDFEILLEGSQLILKKTEEQTSCVLMIRLIEGQYPNYKKLIPEKFKKSLALDRDSFQTSLKRVSLLSHEKSKGILMKIDSDTMEISSKNESGHAKEQISVGYKGEGLEVGFNSKYILEALSSFEEGDSQIYFDIQDDMSPGLIHSENDKNYKCVVMPMRI